MADRYAETKHDIDGNIDLVRRHVAEGKNDEAQALSATTEQLISGLPKNQQKRYREALEEAGTPQGVLVPAPTSWEDIPEVKSFVESTAKTMAEGVKHQMEGDVHARKMAEGALQIRLRIPNPAGLPDLKCTSQEGRNAQSAMYARAGEQVGGDQDVVEGALGRLASNVRDQMANVLPEFLRTLDEDRDTAEKFFGKALEANPELSASEAVYQQYAHAGYELPRHTLIEKRRMRRQLKAAETNGDPTTALELKQALGVAPSDPDATLSTDVSKLRRSLAGPAKHLDALETASPELKAEVRETAKEARALAEQIIEATQ